MWPVHTWLPDAHVEAPTAGSVLLAAILLKMAGYGFIRFSLGLFPIASEIFTPLIYTLSVIAIIPHIINCLDARRYEKAYCLFFRSSHGLCNFRNFYHSTTRY
jgi:NADH:ubiquinone oxidoreductase subunit 4 (subunit M)